MSDDVSSTSPLAAVLPWEFIEEVNKPLLGYGSEGTLVGMKTKAKLINFVMQAALIHTQTCLGCGLTCDGNTGTLCGTCSEYFFRPNESDECDGEQPLMNDLGLVIDKSESVLRECGVDLSRCVRCMETSDVSEGICSKCATEIV